VRTRPLPSCKHPDARGTELERQYAQALLSQSALAFETISPLTGSWVDIHVYPTGQGLAVHFRDITDRKRAGQELQTALTRLQDSDRRQDEFLALLSHELRNALAPISNGLALVRLRAPPEPRLQNTLAIMDRQLRHLVHLVDGLLDAADIKHGRLELTRALPRKPMATSSK
jgi:signal transduction histidine kinase